MSNFGGYSRGGYAGVGGGYTGYAANGYGIPNGGQFGAAGGYGGSFGAYGAVPNNYGTTAAYGGAGGPTPYGNYGNTGAGSFGNYGNGASTGYNSGNSSGYGGSTGGGYRANNSGGGNGGGGVGQDRQQRSVFVGNIPYKATESELVEIFSQAGSVVAFRLVNDRETGRPKGFGFCEYTDPQGATTALETLNGMELHGRPLRVGSSK